MEKHSLLNDFPQFQEKIHDLKTSGDAHFKKLAEDYDDLVHHIHRINTDEEVVIDEAAHELKAKMLHLKDTIHSYLSKE